MICLSGFIKQQHVIYNPYIIIVTGKKNRKIIVKNNERFFYDTKLEALMKGSSLSTIDALFSIFEVNSAYIEVMFNNKLISIDFPVLPICKLIDQHVRIKFIDEVERSSHDHKLVHLIIKAKEIYIITTNSFWFNYKLRKFYFLITLFNYVDLWKEMSYICSYIANFLIILSFSTFPVYPDKEILIPAGITREEAIRLHYPSILSINSWSRYLETTYAFTILGTVQLFNSSVILIHHISKVMIPQFKILKQKMKKPAPNPTKLAAYIFRWVPLPKTKLEYNNILILFKLMIDFETLYHFLFVLFTFLTLKVHPFFYLFHLTNLFFRYETMTNLVNTLYISKTLILSVVVLYFMILYWFSQFNFRLFYNQYTANFFCDKNMYMCYFNTLLVPFKNNDNFFLKNVPDNDLYDARFWYDKIYNIFVVSLYILLFPALMIDTFKYISALTKRNNYDKKNICYICGYDRKEIEKYLSYDDHIFKKHNFWNYIYYIMYILSKPVNELTSLQKYLLDEINSNRYNWVPSVLNDYKINK